jgi:hypothetical protein
VDEETLFSRVTHVRTNRTPKKVAAEQRINSGKRGINGK